MGSVCPAYHKLGPAHDREPNAPGYPMGTQVHDNLVYQYDALSHVAASFGSKTAQQFRSNSWHFFSLPRAKGVCFPKILLKISQVLQGRLMYHIDYLTDRVACREQL
jgi:hypothetical protein